MKTRQALLTVARRWGCLLIPCVVIFLAADRAAAGNAAAFSSDEPAVTLFGSETFVRSAGEPLTQTRTFAVPAIAHGPFRLLLRNGDGEGTGGVSSAVIVLNGVQIVGPSDFSQTIDVIHPDNLERDVALEANNTLTVELRSKPGAGITLQIIGSCRICGM